MRQESNAGSKQIPLSVPNLGGNEWAYIKECLDTNWVSYVGPFVGRFERDLSVHTGCRFAIAMNSGTSALHLALLTAGVERNTEVIMPAISFVAPANAVAYCGASPVLIDISPIDWQMDVEKLDDFLTKVCVRKLDGLWNRVTDRRISAILPVHLLGDLADVDAIGELAQKFELPMIEDAAECLGARYKGRPIGAAIPGFDPEMRQVITSFNGNKIVTTGCGGAILTDSERLSRHSRHLSTTAKTDPLRFQHDEVGYNYRLNNISAALGTAQLERLEEFVSIKRRTAATYELGLQDLANVRLHPQSPNGESIFWLYTVMTEDPSLPLIEKLNSLGIQVRPLWTPLNELPMFSNRVYSHQCAFSPYLHRHALSLPSSVGITGEEIAMVVTALCKCMEAAPIDAEMSRTSI